ncbi:hypothetical protein ABI59_17835 [Acidobacteria bacterium Mor1]|nr:hypothetical protein ABI59_17835 [Acidobacteria bacterium Mor1]
MVRAALLPLLLVVTLSALFAGTATVYRDENGVPHIEADTEEAAWYALGFEEARDALMYIQFNVKRWRGEEAKYVDPTGLAPDRDMTVKILETHLGFDEEVIRRTLELSSPREAEHKDQLFFNLKAYTAGIEAYREELLGQPDHPHHHYLREQALDWVLEHPIYVGDVASWGRFNKGWTGAGIAALGDRTRNSPPNVPFAGNGLEASADSALPTHEEPQGTIREQLTQGGTEGMKELKERMAGIPGMGSNGMCWTFFYQREGERRYSGCMGDPQGPAVPDAIFNQDVFSGILESDRPWFAHIVVNNPEDPVNVFGYVHHGAGVMFISHNQDVAYGGSAGSPNLSDTFLLRMAMDDEGYPALPYRVYNHYADSNGNNGEDPEDWLELIDDPITVERRNSTPVTRTIWRAGPFGFVNNRHVLFVRANEPWHWGLDPGTPSNEYFATPQRDAEGNLITVPVVVSWRVPLDRNVDSPEIDHHSRMANGFYRVMKARTIYDVWEKVYDHDLSFMVNFCAVDREGRLFASVIGTIPERGDLEAIIASSAEPKHAFDVWDIYDKSGDQDPVPARYYGDRIFDWRLNDQANPASGVRYLDVYPADADPPSSYQPYIYFDPNDTAANNPPFSVDDELEDNVLGFVTASNDAIWNYFKKRWTLTEIEPEPGAAPSSDVAPFAPIETDNLVLRQIFQAGTMYHTALAGWYALPKNHAMIDEFEKISSGFISGTQQPAPFTHERARDFVEGNWHLATYDYKGPRGDGVLVVDGAEEAFTSRIAHEVFASWDQGPFGPISQEFDREVRFFEDLMSALQNPPDGSDWQAYSDELGEPSRYEGESLYDIWVANTFESVFRYGESGLIEDGMPPHLGLIDFDWTQSEIGSGRIADVLADSGLSGTDRAHLEAAFQLLVEWDVADPGANRHRVEPGSQAATLLAQYGLGYDAGHRDFLSQENYRAGRKWVPLFNGQPASGSEANPFCYDTPPSGGPEPLQFVQSYGAYRFLANPLDPHASIVGDAPGLDLTRNLAAPPYDALYIDEAARDVRTQLSRAQVTELVEFFLELGGWLDGNNVSGKREAFLETRCAVTGQNNNSYYDFSKLYAPTYPLTRNMSRLLVLRRLLAAKLWLEAEYGEIPAMQQIYQARYYSANDQLYHQGPVVAEGDGGIRPVGCLPIIDPVYSGPNLARLGIESQRGRGFQREMYCYGGGMSPVLTYLPYRESPDDPLEPAQAYFWNVPGQVFSDFDSPHHADMVDNWALRQLLDSHEQDYDEGGAPAASHTYPLP